MRTPTLLLLALAALAPVPAAHVRIRQDTPDLAQTSLDLDALAARDARIAFSSDSGARARAVLDSAPEAVEDRAVAALALASDRATGDLSRIESLLAAGLPLERRAALFALAEMGPVGWDALAAASRDEPADLAELEDALAVALLFAERAGAPGAARLAELAGGEGEPARMAQEARAYLEGASARALSVALVQRYELRWRAAKAYGLVDGRKWSKMQAREWFADEEFLDRVVLAAAADLPEVELRTHLFELLLADERPGVLRVAALEMPDELVEAHASGAWAPSLDGWRAMLAEIDARRAERTSRKLVELAYETLPELEAPAGLLLLRAGGEIPWSWVVAQLEQGSEAERAHLVEALGDRGDAGRIGDLANLLTARPDLGLAASGLVALARLGHPPSVEALSGVTREPASAPSRDATLAALARVLHDKALRAHAQRALELEDLPLSLRLDLELGLALSGERVERDLLRRTLPFAAQNEKRFLVVRALAERPDEADLAALAGLFPVEDDADLNVELALALLRHRHAAMKGCLAAALWGSNWNRSVLAGGLVYRNAGLRGLLEELGSPPRTASERDLRRVGFALGEWGGLAAVEELARTRKEGDPELQGAFLGALSSRAAQASQPAKSTGTRTRITLPSGIEFPETDAGPAGAGPGAGRAGGGFPGKKRPKPGGG
jgi:hypothetical protein